MPVDVDALEQAIRSLQDVHEGEGSVDDALRHIVDVADTLFDVDGAGLMLVDDGRALRYVAASDEPGGALEHAQERLGVGPCVDSLVLDTVVRARDLDQEPRWAPLAAEVVPLGVRAVLGVPVHLAGGSVGSLNLYSARVHEWDDAEVDAIEAFNGILENLLATALLARRQSDIVSQLQHRTLDNRVVIDRAVGMIMGRDHVDPVAAFNHLRSLARSQRQRVHEVAETVLAGVAAEPRV